MTVLRYLLDTNILVALIRNQHLGQYIEATFQPFLQADPPLLSIVSEAEIRSLAVRFRWARSKLKLMEDLLALMELVEINSSGIVPAYVEIDLASLAHSRGARTMGQNDLWIDATAKVTGATLLTTDKDFDHLHPTHLQRIYVDPASALTP